MAVTKNTARQELVCAHVDIDFAALAGLSGADAQAIDLPVNAVVVSGQVVTLTAFNSATSDVLDVGDAGSQNRYLNDTNIHATGIGALVPTGYQHTASDNKLTVRWVGVGAVPTAGKVRLQVQYYVVGRAAFSQG